MGPRIFRGAALSEKEPGPCQRITGDCFACGELGDNEHPSSSLNRSTKPHHCTPVVLVSVRIVAVCVAPTGNSGNVACCGVTPSLGSSARWQGQ